MSIRATISIAVVEASVSAAVPEASVYHTLLTASGIYTDPLSGNRIFTHPISIADLNILITQKGIADSLGTFIDSIGVEFQKQPSDSVSIVDIPTRTVEYNRLFTDGFALDDATFINKDYSGTKGNVFAFSDSNSWGVTKGVADTVASSDYAVLAVGRAISGDAVSMLDTSIFQLTAQYGDSVAISDLITIDHRSASSIVNATSFNVATLNS
jgi:hypothetical protein